MTKIDWNKVAEDYKKSSLDLTRLEQYAKKAACELCDKSVSFDGYTDMDWHEPPKESQGVLGKLHDFFCPAPDTRPALVRQHIGYWILESSRMEYHGGIRYTEGYITKNCQYRQKRTNVFTDYANINTMKWVLLENGELAVHTMRELYKECMCFESLWIVKEIGSNAFHTEKPFEKQITDTWELMKVEDILLLDHKPREIKRRHVGRDDYDVEDSIHIREENYLLTGKKGGGCSKKISALLQKHHLLESKPKGGHSGSSF